MSLAGSVLTYSEGNTVIRAAMLDDNRVKLEFQDPVFVAPSLSYEMSVVDAGRLTWLLNNARRIYVGSPRETFYLSIYIGGEEWQVGFEPAPLSEPADDHMFTLYLPKIGEDDGAIHFEASAIPDITKAIDTLISLVLGK